MASSGVRLTRRLYGLPALTLFGQPITGHMTNGHMTIGRALTPSTAAAAHHINRRSYITYDPALRPIATQMSSASEAKIQLNPPRIVLSREMEMEDTQMFGLVHGCTQLQLVEDAGTTLTTNYCNHFAPKSGPKIRTMSGCLERADFLKPMLVGDIAEVEAEITYATARSLQVTATVYAKNKDDGSRYKTVEAKTWYVPKTVDDEPVTAEAPPLLDENGAVVRRPESEAGYQTIKEHRQRIHPELYDRPYRPYIVDYYASAERIEKHTVDYSRCTFSLPIHPNHSVPGEDYCRGGVILRLMDETGGLTAALHNNHYSFTANMEAVLFHRKVEVGQLLQHCSRSSFEAAASAL